MEFITELLALAREDQMSINELKQETVKVREVIRHIGPIPILIPLKLFLDLLQDPVFPRGLTDSQSHVLIFTNVDSSANSTQRFASFAIYHQTKMAEDVEKNACTHFVDERDFKEVSVVGKRKSKKNRKADFGNMKGKLESSVRQKNF